MRRLWICTLFLALVSPAARAQSQYVGLRYPPLPPDLQDLGGWLISTKDSVQYAVTEIVQDSNHMLWLKRPTFGIANGRAYRWEVRAVLELPRLGPHQAIMLGSCAVGGMQQGGDASLVGIATFVGDSLFASTIDYLWRVNVSAQRFHAIPADGVICFRETYPNEDPAPPPN